MKLRTATLTTLLAQLLLLKEAWGHPGHAHDDTSVLDVVTSPLVLVLLVGLALGVGLARRRSPV